MVQRHWITSAAGPRGSPGNMSSAPPTTNGLVSSVCCWSAARCVGRVRVSMVANHTLKGAGSPRSSASSTAARKIPALTAPIVSVRATTRALFGQRSLPVAVRMVSTSAVISGMPNPSRIPFSIAATMSP